MSTAFSFAQTDPYWTVETLTARDRSRIGNQTVCGLVEMLRLAARANCSALLNIRRPPPDHPRYRSWFMDTLWAVQKAGISHKRVRTVGAFIMISIHSDMLIQVVCGIANRINRQFLNLLNYAYL